MIILRYNTSLQLKNHRSYDKNIKRVIFQSFRILSIFFRHVTWTSLLKCLIIWKEKFIKHISMDQIAYCNQLLFILVKKLISSHEIKRNTSVNEKCLLFFYSDFTNSENPASILGGFRFGGCGAFRFFLDFFRFFEINSLNQDKSNNYFQQFTFEKKIMSSPTIS